MHLRSHVVTLLAAPLLAVPLSLMAQSPEAVTPAVVSGTDIITTYAGDGAYSYCGDGSKATVACVAHPQGLAFHNGNLYIADQANGVIREVNSSDIISTFAGENARNHSYAGDGGTALSAGLNNPSDIAFDSLGNMYIADQSNNVIRKVSTAGIITTYAGTGAAGYNGDGGQAKDAELKAPYSVVLDGANNLYISDYGNNVIRKVTYATGIINTVAGTGVPGDTGNGGPAVDAELNMPAGMFFNTANNTLYFADSGSSVIREINSAGTISVFAGTGAAITLSGSGACSAGKATSANLTSVIDVAFDASGNAYITNYLDYGAPYGFSEVCKIDTTGTISLVAGTAAYGYSGDGGPADKAELNTPTYLAFDPTGNLYVADTDNNRVRKVTMNPVPAPPTFSPVGGTYPGPISVTIDALSGLQIHYTTNGTTPTISSPEYVGAIPVTETTTIKAIAYSATEGESAVASATYIIAPIAAEPIFSPPAGTYIKSVTVKLTDATKGAVLHCTTNGSTPTSGSPVCPASIVVTATETIKAIAVATGFTNSVVASAVYTIDEGITATPTFSVAGGVYGTEKLVSLADATAGAVIYYTVNGATPTTASTKYTGPIAVTSTETIKAIAVAPKYETSAVVSEAYTLIEAPSVLTGLATGISTAGATLNALVSTGGVAATFSFQYGTSSTALTSSTKAMTLSATTSRVDVGSAVTGLKTKTTYYFRAVVTTLGGSVTSAVGSFTTD